MRGRMAILAGGALLTVTAIAWLLCNHVTLTYRAIHLPAADDSSAHFEALPPDTAAVEQLQAKVRRTVRTVRAAVVAVTNPGQLVPRRSGRLQGSASGVIISADGFLLSQWHVSHRKGDGADPYPASYEPGTRTTVILADGRECPAELLGADPTYDLSLLRLTESASYPYVPLKPDVIAKVGDWVLMAGHAGGYRPDRPAPFRLGRVLIRAGNTFCTDCLITGGDSGGPFFDLDGNLVGIVNGGFAYRDHLLSPDEVLAQRCLSPTLAKASPLIYKLLDRLKRREVAHFDIDEANCDATQMFQQLKERMVPAGDWSQGPAVLAAYRLPAESAGPCVVTVLNGTVPAALGMLVSVDRWVVTKASELPPEPKCLLPSGEVVAIQVVGADPVFDLAMFRIPTTGLRPICWAEMTAPPEGTLLAAVGADGLPLAAGIVSVARRDLAAVAPPKYLLPLRIPAYRPDIDFMEGMSDEKGYLVSRAWGRALAAGIRKGDLIDTLSAQPIRSRKDLEKWCKGRLTGDRIRVELLRGVGRGDIGGAVIRRIGDRSWVELLGGSERVALELPLTAAGTMGDMSNYRSDDFPTIFEYAAGVTPHECGGPLIDLQGRTVGVTIARAGEHGCLAIPGDQVRRLLPDLQSGKLAGNWVWPQPAAKPDRP